MQTYLQKSTHYFGTLHLKPIFSERQQLLCNYLFTKKSKQYSFLNTFKHGRALSFWVLITIFLCNISLVTAQTTKTWNPTNNTTTDWNTATNWSPSGVPTASSDIVINVVGSGKKYPITPSGGGVCRTINAMQNGTYISGSGTLTIKASGTLTIAANSDAYIYCPLNLSGGTTTSFSIPSLSSLTIVNNISGNGNINISDVGPLKLTAPNIITTIDATFNNVSITANGAISLASGVRATINGALSLSAGVFTIGAGELVANGSISYGTGLLSGDRSSNLTLGGNQSSQSVKFSPANSALNNLNLVHGASNSTILNSSLDIYGGINFGGSFDNLDVNSSHLTLKSDYIGTAYVGEIKGTLTNATNVTVERYMDRNQYGFGSRGWRLLTIPVTGQTIRQAWAGANANPAAPAGEAKGNGTLITGNGYATGSAAAAAGFDWFTGLGTNTTSSIRYYTPSNSWASATNTPSTLSAPDKQGYMLYVRGDRTVATPTDSGYVTLAPTGTLKQGSQTIAVSDPFTVVGNPYASPIDLDAFYHNSGNSAVINQNFWLWDATLGTTGAYRSLSWNGVDAYDMIGGNGEPATDYLTLNSGQAFFVEKKAAGNVQIQESNKTTTTPMTMFRQMGVSTVSNLSIKLYLATGSTIGIQADGVVARYNNIYSVSPNEIYDAAKMNNFNENLSLLRNGRYLSVESRPYPTQNDTLFVPFWGLSKRDYALTITSNYLNGLNQLANLYDAFTNTWTPIDMGAGATVTHLFTVTTDPASSSLNRFIIIMAPVGSGVLPVTFTNISATHNGSGILIDWHTATEMGTKSYDVEKSTDGVHFSKISNVPASATLGGHYQVPDQQPVKGNNYYRIRGNEESGKITYSSIVSVQLAGQKAIQVVPTLVSNQHFAVLFTNQPAGVYKIALTNTAGQQVFTKTTTTTSGNSMLDVNFNRSQVPAGIYTLTVTDAGKKAVQQCRMVVE